MSTVSTHVLDSSRGRPAVGVPVRLERDGELLAAARTDDDGRARELTPDGVPAGTYRLVFDTGAYFAATGQRGFYPEVSITFEIGTESSAGGTSVGTESSAGGTSIGTAGHYHVPLLLSPFAYSTYRGS